MFLFCNYLPLEKGMALHLNTLKLIPKEAFCQVKFILYQLFLRRRFLNFVNVFRYFFINFLWKRAWFFICKIMNSLHPRILCVNFCWNWSSSNKEKIADIKSLQTDGRTRGDQKSSLELPAQVSYKTRKTIMII